jgi:imidazolonepropionase-like amidohydrolase
MSTEGFRIDGKVIDGTLRDPIEHGSVVVIGDSIAWVGETASLPEKYAAMNLESVSVPGGSVMPGIVDAHVHVSFGEAQSEEENALYTPVEYRSMLAAWNVRKVLRAGVTSICDPASTYNISACLRDAIEAGIVEGPRMAAAGRQLTSYQGLEDAFPSWMEYPVGQAGVLVNSKDDIVSAVRLQAKEGVDIIKVSGSDDSIVSSSLIEGMAFTDEEFKLIADETHRLAKKCTVHARTAASIRACAAAGFDWLQHASFMDSEGLEIVLEKQIPIIPALPLLVNLLEASSQTDIPAALLDVFKREVDAASENLGNAYRQGATLIAGSETGWSIVPYGNWHGKEMEILVTHMGLTPLQAIHAGTGAAAVTLPNWCDRIGTLEVGKLADVIAFDGDPSKDIRVLNNPSKLKMVMKGGSMVDITTPIPDRREYSWERNKVYLNGRYRYDASASRGYISRL